MKYNPEIHHRRSIRFKGYDYSQTGAYFVTICTQNRECLFGDIVNEKMVLNDAGRMIQTIWDEMPEHYFGVAMDIFQIMPNHVHGIVILTDPVTVGAGPRACPHQTGQSHDIGQPQNGQPQNGQPRGVAPTLSLPDVVHRFKSLTTARYRHRVKQHDWPPFPGKLWQRNYYEHIIRDENELNHTREYITQNPAKWALDRENVRADLGVCPQDVCPQEEPWQV